VDLSGAITPACLRDLRIPIENYFKGNAQGTVKVVQDHKKNIAVSVNATADQADIVISELGLSKARGVPAESRIGCADRCRRHDDFFKCVAVMAQHVGAGRHGAAGQEWKP
jgi:hypothetical protein